LDFWILGGAAKNPLDEDLVVVLGLDIGLNFTGIP
jgi:hypothetical protein